MTHCLREIGSGIDAESQSLMSGLLTSRPERRLVGSFTSKSQRATEQTAAKDGDVMQ
jgi:hypothetical protein